MNEADSEKLAAGLAKLGWEPAAKADAVDLAVVNTCVVRQKAEDRAIGYMGRLRQLKESREGMQIAVTYGGSPALFTGTLKDHNVTVLHQAATVRHARGAEAQGVDIVIAEGFEGGGLRGPDQVSTMVLVPQVVTSSSIPVIASGGVVDARGVVAARALGAQGVQMGSRFGATEECISHQN